MRLCDFILAHSDGILSSWVGFIRSNGPAAGCLDDADLRDHAYPILSALAHALDGGVAQAPALDSLEEAARAHAVNRVRQGFTLDHWRDPFADQKGNVWFVGQVGNYVARLDPKTGEFKRYEVEEGTHPHNLVVDAKGQVWFTGNQNGRIVRLDPATGKLTNYMMPDPSVRELIEQGKSSPRHGRRR